MNKGYQVFSKHNQIKVCHYAHFANLLQVLVLPELLYQVLVFRLHQYCQNIEDLHNFNADFTRQTHRLIFSDFMIFLKMHTNTFVCTDAVGRLLTELGRNGTFGRED